MITKILALAVLAGIITTGAQAQVQYIPQQPTPYLNYTPPPTPPMISQPFYTQPQPPPVAPPQQMLVYPMNGGTRGYGR